jgi:predicted site-specific integrase-resolvase
MSKTLSVAVPPTPTSVDILVPLTEAARRLGMKPKTLQNWVYSRKIEVVHIGGRAKVKVSTIQELIDRGTVAAAGER